MTDRYQEIAHHPTVKDFAMWAKDAQIPLVGIDIRPGSEPIEGTPLPQRCVLVFGQEGPGLSDEMASYCAQILHITQYGSTRSINVGVASGIAMHHYLAHVT